MLGRTAAELGCSAGRERVSLAAGLAAHRVGCLCSRLGCAATCAYGRGSVFWAVDGIVGGR